MDNIAKKLGITDTVGWFNIRKTSIQAHGGLGVLDKYNGVLTKLLMSVYPEYANTCRQKLLQITKDLKLTEVKELISVHQLVKMREPHMLRQHGHSVIKRK